MGRLQVLTVMDTWGQGGDLPKVLNKILYSVISDEVKDVLLPIVFVWTGGWTVT